MEKLSHALANIFSAALLPDGFNALQVFAMLRGLAEPFYNQLFFICGEKELMLGGVRDFFEYSMTIL
ncbi:MAG: hypothetical protein IMY76_08625 [Chloroflexi bacterium]|nr:hypothetical protein [Chloroflexota bacterium]